MQKITIFQHLVHNASRVIRKKGNDDVEIDAIGLCFFPLMGNYFVVIMMVEYYLLGNVNGKIPENFLVGLFMPVPILLYFHAKKSRKAVKAYYKALDTRTSRMYLIIFIAYFIISVSLIFVVRESIVAGKI